MNRDRIAALCIAAAALVTGAAAALADNANTIVQVDRAFRPTEITIARGTTLDFANRDEFIHQIYVDTQGFNYDSEEQQPGQTFHITFPATGTFAVRCHIHPKMLLTVHVK
jgi:plastocyanin